MYQKTRLRSHTLPETGALRVFHNVHILCWKEPFLVLFNEVDGKFQDFLDEVYKPGGVVHNLGHHLLNLA